MFICKHEVQYYETDRMGITHHSNYVRWMEEARTFFLREIGWPYEKIEEEELSLLLLQFPVTIKLFLLLQIRFLLRLMLKVLNLLNFLLYTIW